MPPAAFVTNNLVTPSNFMTWTGATICIYNMAKGDENNNNRIINNNLEPRNMIGHNNVSSQIKMMHMSDPI